MTSGVPQNFDAAFVAGIDKLIKRAEVIDGYIDPYDEYAMNEDVVLRDLMSWMDEVNITFSTNELKRLLPHNFSVPRKMKPPRTSGGKLFAFGDSDLAQKSMAFRKELHQHISSQISALVKIKSTYKELLEPIIIHIDKDGLVWRDDRDKYSFKFKNTHTKRVRLIIMLSKFTRHVGTDKIMKHVPYSSLQTLSKEKGWINETLQKELELPDDLIESGGKTAHVGYRIKPIFVIKIEK